GRGRAERRLGRDRDHRSGHRLSRGRHLLVQRDPGAPRAARARAARAARPAPLVCPHALPLGVEVVAETGLLAAGHVDCQRLVIELERVAARFDVDFTAGLQRTQAAAVGILAVLEDGHDGDAGPVHADRALQGGALVVRDTGVLTLDSDSQTMLTVDLGRGDTYVAVIDELRILTSDRECGRHDGKSQAAYSIASD